MADFRFRSQFPIAGIANLIANKPVQEEQLRLARSQEKRAKFNQFLNTLSTTASLARVGQQIRATNEAAKQQKIEQQNRINLAQELARVDSGLSLGQEGPLTARGSLMGRAAMVAPEQTAQSIISPKQNKPVRGFAGATILPDNVARITLKSAGLSNKEIKQLEGKNGILALSNDSLNLILKAKGKSANFFDIFKSLNTGNTGANVPEFNTEEEARAAGFGPGDRVIINGEIGTLD